MQTAQSSRLKIERNVALTHIGIEAVVPKFFAAKRPRKESTFIRSAIEFYDDAAVQSRFPKDHLVFTRVPRPARLLAAATAMKNLDTLMPATF